MGITRKSLFGFPPRANQGSAVTVREVPLSQGVRLDGPWTDLPPGSTISMSNFLPLDGVLVPRSRLSSFNTIRMPTASVAIGGIGECPSAIENGNYIWLSSQATQHALLTSNGSISRASFVSSFGLGAGSLTNHQHWQYAPVFIGTLGTLGENVLLTTGAGSADTIIALYQTGGSGTGQPLYSYLTSAPKTKSIAVYDNYVIAWNVLTSSVVAPTRVQWCVRGSPSNWTSEGSGFEDLLAMRGVGTAVRATADGRLILFSDMETWYGVGASYPAQFQFLPLDQSIGCAFPRTIAECDLGLIFLGSDRHLRILPRGGGTSTVVAPQVAQVLRTLIPLDSNRPSTWGVYDPDRRMYHLFIEQTDTTLSFRGLVVNIETGEWGFMDYNTSSPIAGIALTMTGNPFGKTETLMFGNSTGTVFSANSLAVTENGSAVTSFWRSAPIGVELPGNYKQITQIDVDYRATSKSTITIKVSQDGGNNYEATGRMLSLASAPVAGRATSQVYIGGAFPALEVKSESTGYRLHRLDVTMNIEGRRA